MGEIRTDAPAVTIGRVCITRGAADQLQTDDIYDALVRHMLGDWGNVDESDWKSNDDAVELGFRILSSYVDRQQHKFWIITEADRSLTTILLPEEY